MVTIIRLSVKLARFRTLKLVYRTYPAIWIANVAYVIKTKLFTVNLNSTIMVHNYLEQLCYG
ncbi:MAG: hypothetical protein RLZ75_2493 [Pseudomonadota bacterium]